MYDTPPSGRWQRPVPSSLGDDDGIYDTPRSVPPQTDSETEVINNAAPSLNHRPVLSLLSLEGDSQISLVLFNLFLHIFLT